MLARSCITSVAREQNIEDDQRHQAAVQSSTQQPATDASQSALFSLDTAGLPSQVAWRGIINIKHDCYLRVKIRQTPTRSRAIKHLSKLAPEWRLQLSCVRPASDSV